MKKIGVTVAFEVQKMISAKTTMIYMGIYLISFLMSAVFFRLYGSEYTVLTVGNAQSFPLQHLQSSFLLTGVFMAIYVAQISVQERSMGTIKITLLRPVSRFEYFISKVISIYLFSLLLTLMMIVLGYGIGLVVLGWGDQMVFQSLSSGGIEGVLITLLCGLVFSIAYFAFGMIALLVSMFSNKLLESAIVMGILLLVGQYLEIFPSIKKFAVFHQMLFLHMDIIDKPFADNLISFLVLFVYIAVCGIIGFLLFEKKDLYV